MMMANAQEKTTVQYSLFFIQRFKGKVLFNVPMGEYTSLKVGGPADVMAFPQDDGDLKDLLAFARHKRFAVYILGSGTNLLVRDGGIRGVVVNMSEGFKDLSWLEEAKLVVGSGVKLASVVHECTERSLGGMEFAVNIPGTVGGAVAMNAGAYGAEMADVVEGVEVIDAKGRRGFVPRSELGFSYRSAEIPAGSVVVRAHMRFSPSAPEEIEERLAAFRDRRRKTSSIQFPNAGSVFKNPEGMVAGRLIEEAGLKGARSGDAAVSEVHANYIVNTGRASARDVLSLMALVRDKVFSRTGVVLEPEIRVVGED